MNTRRGAPRDHGPVRAAGPLAPGQLAGVLSAVGLVVVAVVSVGLLSGNLPGLPQGPGSSGNPGPVRTATPSNVVIVDPRADVPGMLAYAKAGNIWIQRRDEAEQLTDGGRDSMPAFSPDGVFVYFIRTTPETGRWRVNGAARRYRLAIPTLMRIPADGSGEPEALLTGKITSGDLSWSYFLRQPAISPDGTKAALVTDGPDPTRKDVVLQVLDLATLTLTDLGEPESAPLGHQDPAWSPDGAALLYVRNGRDGSRGASLIVRYDVATGTSAALTGPGYSTPTWSPDGRYIAATRTTAFGTDIVVLNARGSELLRLTNGQRSFSPVWSPVGDAIAYLEIERGVTDLWLAPVDAGSDGVTPDGERFQLTIAAGLAAGSRPAWWVPAELIPTPAPTLAPTATPGSSPSAAAP